MGFGELVKEKFKVIKPVIPPPQLPVIIGENGDRGCDYCLPVFWSTENNDLKNDKSDYFLFFESNIKSALLTLQKCKDNEFVNVQNVGTNIGKSYPLGFISNQFDQRATGCLIDWKKVYNLHGNGKYRVKCIAKYAFQSDLEFYSFEFELSEYANYRADKSVKFETRFKGVYEDQYDNKRIDFDGFEWVGQIRLSKSFFGFSKSTFEKEFIKYQNGSQVWISDKQIESFIYSLSLAPSYIHSYFKKFILQADDIYVTDYNLKNPEKYNKKNVIFNSSYEPKWQGLSNYATVEIEMIEKIQLKEKKRC